MAAFRFEAIDINGKVSQGVVDADSLKLARTRLRDMGLAPVKVETLHDQQQTPNSTNQLEAGQSKTRPLFSRNKISSYDLSQFTRQLSILLNAGLNIEHALAATAEQIEKQALKELLLALRAEVMAGNSLSRAMMSYPAVLDDTYCAIISAGEQSGELPLVLDRLASYIESRHVLRQKVIAAFIYPALITLTSILVVGALLIYVVPQIVTVFQQSKQTLPLLTVAMIFISDVLRSIWLYLLALIIIATWLVNRALQNKTYRHLIDVQLLKLPILGKLILSINTAKFANTLAILVGSGVPIITALHGAARSTPLLPMKQAILDAIDLVKDGGNLSRALKESQLFPPVLIHLIANAEQTGNLEHMLDSAATQQENEVNHKIVILTGLLEPLLIIVMGGIVMLIVLAVMLPIIQINQLIH
jgi:general secretion pathway protein F